MTDQKTSKIKVIPAHVYDTMDTLDVLEELRHRHILVTNEEYEVFGFNEEGWSDTLGWLEKSIKVHGMCIYMERFMLSMLTQH